MVLFDRPAAFLRVRESKSGPLTANDIVEKRFQHFQLKELGGQGTVAFQSRPDQQDPSGAVRTYRKSQFVIPCSQQLVAVNIDLIL